MPISKEFSLTDKQKEARSLIADPVLRYILLVGGSRSGKTFLALYAIVIRAVKADGSRHAVLRFRFNAVKASIGMDTLPKLMKLCFPNVKYKWNKTDWIMTLQNGSEIWLGGLDDKERTEKILGQEFATIYLNETSQISYASVGIVLTRLAQMCLQNDGVPLALRMLYDCNPPDKNHWTYKAFYEKLDPITKTPIAHPHLYGHIQMNPRHNIENLSPEYLESLEGLPPHLRRRFLDGSYKDANPNAIFPQITLDQWRVDDPASLPDMVKVVVGVDPSGSDDDGEENGNDPIGIYVAGLGVDGVAYLMEDCTVNAGPATWGKMSVSAYKRNEADVMVGEQNFGGAMVKYVIQSIDRDVNYKIVKASRGKVQRAEPFSPLFFDGRIRIVGHQNDLEEELEGFSTSGYTGDKSPNVADAAFWCLAELFPGIVGKKAKTKKEFNPIPTVSHWG